MNLMHPLSEPAIMVIMLMVACASFFVILLYFVWAGHRPARTDAVKHVIHQCDEHCRIKAEYDCHG